MARLVAITGGIGAGKSYISCVLTKMGYKVYDCDSNAKRLMRESVEISTKIRLAFGDSAICEDGSINNSYVAGIVFSDKARLSQLNSIVHPAVAEDIKRWSIENVGDKMLFVETAILHESGLDKLVDEVIEVTASLEVRIARVQLRNGLSREAIINRINSQHSVAYKVDYKIINNNDSAIVPQIADMLHSLDNKF